MNGRRRARPALMVVLAPLLLAVSACGAAGTASAGDEGAEGAASVEPAGSEGSAGSTASEGSGSGEAAVGEFPRTVEHTMGTTEIPAEPMRIVAVNGNLALDALLALDITPVGAGEEGNADSGEGTFAPYLTEEQMEGITVLHSRPEVQVEEVLALEPDLILAQDATIQELYPQLSQIAPTVAYTYDDVNWRDTFRLIAESVGREEAAEEIVGELDAQIEAAAEEVAGDEREISVFYAFDGFYGMMGDQTFVGAMLAELGLQQVESQLGTTLETNQIEFTEEQIDLVDGDAIYSLVFLDANEDFMPVFEAKPTFQNLEGVKAGGYERLGAEQSYHWYYPSVLTAPLLVEDLVERHGGQ